MDGRTTQAAPARQTVAEGLALRELAQRFIDWLMTIDSDDPSAYRRARTFIPLMSVLSLVSSLSTVVMALSAPGPFVEIQWIIVPSSAASALVAVLLARRGLMDLAGFIAGGTTLVVFALVAPMKEDVILALGWFFGVGVLLASYAMRPKLLFGMWVFAQACLTTAFRLVEVPVYGQPELWEPTMGMLLMFISLASYIHARSTEQIFAQQLESARQLELARREAEHANRAKSTFLANMSHELRTPLNAILGYSEMLAEDAEIDGDEVLAEDLSRINHAGSHLLSLINDVLDLSKIEAGHMDVYVEVIEVEELLEQVASTMRSVVARNQNQLVVEAAPSCGRVASDRTKVRQLLLNLLSNAAKFTSDGEVRVTARRRTRGGRRVLEFSVTDTGIGMNEEQLSRVFNEFEQADKSTTREYGGTGLGLALCKRLSHLLEGDIEVTSAPGVGSTFTFYISVEHSETPDEVAAKLYAPDPAPGGLEETSRPLTQAAILVIDDDPDSHDLLARALAAEDVTLHSASSGKAGLAMLRDGLRVDLVLLDILMPEEDGWQVLRRLKDDPLTSHLPVVLMSVIDEQQRGLELGASDYVTKPIERDRLLGAIEGLTSQATSPVEVLLVEDDEDTRELMRRILDAEGWRVLEACDGQQAMETLESATPDIIVLDLMMPRMDGFDVLRALRAAERWRQLPVVIATAKELDEDERALLREGAAHVMQKGDLDARALVALARRVLAPGARALE